MLHDGYIEAEKRCQEKAESQAGPPAMRVDPKKDSIFQGYPPLELMNVSNDD